MWLRVVNQYNNPKTIKYKVECLLGTSPCFYCANNCDIITPVILKDMPMDNKDKCFIKPEAIFIVFNNEDIITISEGTTDGFLNDGDRERWF